MLEFIRSLLSFSWAMSLFGVQQFVNLLVLAEATHAFDEVSAAAASELNAPLRTTLKTANTLIGSFTRPHVGLTFRQNTPQVTRRIAGSEQPAAVSAERPHACYGIGAQTRHNNLTSACERLGATGPCPAPGAVTPISPAEPPSFAEPNISEEYPYDPHYVEVFGSRIHFIEQGTGDPILLLHGNPTWSYLWRNVIPHLSSLGRCIAPDLIGYGRSDKPDIQYDWYTQSRYLEEFIRVMGLRNVTLVLHDHGSGLGFHYAMRNEHNVRAIAFFEAIVRPFPWDEFSSPQFREMFKKFRSGGRGGEGWQTLVERNVFIEELLPQASGRKLTEREMTFYREPFPDPQSRIPIWLFARETPIGGEPEDVWKTVSLYSQRLQKSALPKLMLYFTPGALLTAENVEWCRRNIRNLSAVPLGPGLHFVQESSPHLIGETIARWLIDLGTKTERRIAVGAEIAE